MRYVVQFMDGNTKRVSKEEGEKLIQALNNKNPVILKGAWFPHHQITSVKPIDKNWFDKEYVEQEKNKELTHVKKISTPKS